MPSQLQPLLLLVLFGVVVYFLMIRPQQKRRKQTQEMQSSLKPGSEIVTTAGMYGKVVSLEDDAVLLEVAPGVTCKYMRQAVMRVVPEAAPVVEEPAAVEASKTDDEAADKEEPVDKTEDSAAADEPEKAEESDAGEKDKKSSS